MRLASIRDFKAHLARYLRLVEAGDSVAVTRHGRPIALVVLPSKTRGTAEPVSEVEWWEAALRNGEILPAESRAKPRRVGPAIERLARATMRRFVRERRS